MDKDSVDSALETVMDYPAWIAMDGYIDAIKSIGIDEASRALLERAVASERMNATSVEAPGKTRRSALRIAAAVKNELHDAENQGTPTGEAWDNLILEVELSAAIELFSRTLEITASFEDGSELTRSYRIFFVPDFEEIWLRNEEAFIASFEEGAPAYEPEQLYALQQFD